MDLESFLHKLTNHLGEKIFENLVEIKQEINVLRDELRELKKGQKPDVKNAATSTECDQFIEVIKTLTDLTPIPSGDNIADLIENKFESFSNEIRKHRKVLAGVVMKNELNEFSVIVVTTGSKCIFGRNLLKNGTALQDMHAEILARRCLVAYFIEQLDLIVKNGEEHSIFQKTKTGTTYRLKNGIEFYLYIDRLPCGSDFENLATKSSDGTKDATNTEQQTWTSLIKNKTNLLTMSCADKINKWNVVGIQGALLTHIIQPIYFSRIIIGNATCNKNKSIKKLDNSYITVEKLPPGYHTNRPLIHLLSRNYYNKLYNKNPTFCTLWSKSDDKSVSVNTATGFHNNNLREAKSSKLNLFEKFDKLFDDDETFDDKQIDFESYGTAKKSALHYNVAKEKFFKALCEKKMGNWLRKPCQVDDFS